CTLGELAPPRLPGDLDCVEPVMGKETRTGGELRTPREPEERLVSAAIQALRPKAVCSQCAVSLCSRVFHLLEPVRENDPCLPVVRVRVKSRLEVVFRCHDYLGWEPPLSFAFDPE